MNLSEVLNYIRELLSSENLVIKASGAKVHMHAVEFVNALSRQEVARLSAEAANEKTEEKKMAVAPKLAEDVEKANVES